MGYADRQLTSGEAVAIRARQHWLAIFVNGRRAWAVLILAIAILIVGTQLSGSAQTALGYVGYALLVLALLWIALLIWAWQNEEYLVTNRRVIKLQGILNKRMADSSLEKINDAVVDQNLVGRIFGYADLDIITAAEQAFDRFRMLSNATLFHRTILEQKHELEVEVATGRPPRMAPPPAPAAVPAMAAATPSPLVGTAPEAAQHDHRMTPDEITHTLDELAGLRDRGAITPAEYESKKADLLGRL